ncbi:MAG: LCP family protein [Actinomycetota bacterium]|nr:LCP family protein [Actinomycetota bacterium]
MSDKDDEHEDLEDDPAGDGAAGDGEEEKDGLGLTEEFARIEAEIEHEVGRSAATGDEPEDGEPEGPREVRSDDTDSSEWAAPVPGGTGSETDEWAAVGEEGFTGEEDAVADDGEEDDVVADDRADDEDDLVAGPDDEDVAVPDDGADGVHGDAVSDVPVAAADVSTPPPEGGSPAHQPPDGPADVDASAAPEPPATEHTIVRPRPLAPRPSAAVGLGAGGGLIDDADLDVKTPALWWRFLTGSMLIVIATATAVALSFLLFLTDVAADLQPIPGIADRLDEIPPGDPQTILIVGSDKRSETPGDPGRSDTTMLLRVDSDNGILSLFSLPRDLKVEIPNYGTGRLNEAYTVGGVKRTLDTVRDLTGLKINHVVNVDFVGFAEAVNAIDCVYVDIDRKYFNSNEGAYGAELYAEIDINAGYQRLCGLDALAYVRYRHEDNDIVRAARQQDFLREARQKIRPSELVFNGKGNDLIDIFTKYTSSDVDEAGEVIEILKAFIAVRDVPIQQVSFEGNLADVDENGVAYVTASEEQIKKAVDEFLNGATTEGPRGGDNADQKQADGDGKKKAEKKKKKEEEDPTAGSSVIEADASFARFGSTSARRLKLPVWVPTAVVPGSTYSTGSRQYEIMDLEDHKQPAYKLVIAYETPSTLTEYYGVEGTTWSDPPILNDKSESREIDGRVYDLYYDGDRLRMVAWHDIEGNSYWISNTLAQTLEEADMLAIAASMNEAHG